MGNPSPLSEINWEVESAFGEDIDTVATHKLSLCAPVDCSELVQKALDTQKTHQYRGDLGDWVRGTFDAKFKTKSYLTGHGSVTTGAVSISSYETLLGYVFGNAVMTATGSTLTGGTANIPTTTDSGTLDPGDLCFIGALGDTDGEGQAYAIATHTTTNLTLLTDLRGAPQNGAVRYGGVTIYPNSAPTSTSVQSVRMHLATANLQYLCHGCHPIGITISGLNPGELPYIEIQWQAAWFEFKASTFPSTVSGDTFNPAANAAGTLFLNTVGTSTNALRTYRNITIEYDPGVITLRGPGGVNAYQDIIGCVRGEDSCTVSWTEDADAATTTPVLPGFFGTRKHALLTLSTADGSRVAFYWPSLRQIEIPSQKAEDNLNRLTVMYRAGVGPTTTSALTLSKMRMHFA
jgi:hypothetical protein